MTYCRPASLEDVEYLSTRLRQSDVYEIWAAVGHGPLRGLLESFNSSDVCRVFCTADDEPLCIHGTAPEPVHKMAASAWLLGTGKLREYRKDFLKHSKIEVARFHEKYPVLFNYVWEGNGVSIAWLKWLGGQFINRHPAFGFAQLPFLEYLHVRSGSSSTAHH